MTVTNTLIRVICTKSAVYGFKNLVFDSIRCFHLWSVIIFLMETASALSLLAVQAVFFKFDLALCRIESA